MSESPSDDKVKYKRNYKACLNCRTRKVKCDLGSVDEPQPPCARCKRERKECVFTESRRGGGHSNGSVAGAAVNSRSATPSSTRKRKLEESTPPIPSTASNNYNNTNNKGLPLPFGLNEASQGINANNATATTQDSFERYSQQSNNTLDSQQDTVKFQRIQQGIPSSYPSNNRLPPIKSTLHHRVQSSEDSLPVPPPKSSEFATMQGALVFLARAAGTIARADGRDNIDARQIHDHLESHTSTPTSSNESPVLTATSVSRQNSNVNNPDQYDITPLIRPQGRIPPSLPPVEKASTVHPNPSRALSDIPYIGPDKMLTEQEAEHLIYLFFLTLHPFFPHVPEQLHDPQILAGYPILLCAILTISSRYHSFGDDPLEQSNKNSRNIQIHERLWIYCQRLISQTVWAEASTRSIGTSLAFLLFTEWNPRAIHWRWSDYANNPEFKDDMGTSGPNLDINDDDGEGLAGLSAMRRSDRMAWMLVGSSVRLSQDMGFITASPEIFVASHIAETNTAMNLGQRSMLAQSLGEVDLDHEEDDESGTETKQERKKHYHDEFILSLDEETLKRRNLQRKTLKFTFSQRAKLELLKITSLAYETIYCGKIDGQHQIQNLTVLSVLSPLIENWYKTYKKLLKPSNPKNSSHHCNVKLSTNKKHVSEITKQLDKESLICDYFYCQLYIYSLALSADNPLNTNATNSKKPLNNVRLDEISKAARFVELAYNAASEILNAAIRVHKLKMLKYMPVRWVTRIVRSVAFIVKCFLTLTNANNQKSSKDTITTQSSTILTLSIIPTLDILQTIQKAAIVLREASPDELHLCTRYSTILMHLSSEMKHRSKLSANPPEMTKLDQSDEDTEINEQVPQSVKTRIYQGNTFPVSNRGVDEQIPPVSTDRNHQPHHQQSEDHDHHHHPIDQEQNNFQPHLYNSSNYPQQDSTNKSNASGNDNSNNFNFGFQPFDNKGIIQPLPDAVVDWFLNNDESIGLDFVEPWTEMIEQHLDKKKTT